MQMGHDDSKYYKFHETTGHGMDDWYSLIQQIEGAHLNRRALKIYAKCTKCNHVLIMKGASQQGGREVDPQQSVT